MKDHYDICGFYSICIPKALFREAGIRSDEPFVLGVQTVLRKKRYTKGMFSHNEITISTKSKLEVPS